MKKAPPDPDREPHGMRLRTAFAGLLAIALGMGLAMLALDGSSGDGPLRSTAELSTMAGVAAHDADQATQGIQLSPRLSQRNAGAVPRGDPEAQVVFDHGSAALPEGIEPLLKEIVSRMAAHPGAIAVISAAEPRRPATDPQHGIAANRLMIDPRSSRAPRVDAASPARIEIHILRG